MSGSKGRKSGRVIKKNRLGGRVARAANTARRKAKHVAQSSPTRTTFIY